MKAVAKLPELREPANLYKQRGEVAAICRQAKRARPPQTLQKISYMSPTGPTPSVGLAHRLLGVRSEQSGSIMQDEVHEIKHVTGHTLASTVFFFVLFFLNCAGGAWGGLNVNLIISAEAGNDSPTNLLDTYLCESCSRVSQFNKQRCHQDSWWHRQGRCDPGRLGKSLPLAPINFGLSERRSGLSRGRLGICRR